MATCFFVFFLYTQGLRENVNNQQNKSNKQGISVLPKISTEVVQPGDFH